MATREKEVEVLQRVNEFREKYRSLVWSNPNADDEIYIRKALLTGRFTVLFDAFVAFGIERLEREWRVLLDEAEPSYQPAIPKTSTILNEMRTGYIEALESVLLEGMGSAESPLSSESRNAMLSNARRRLIALGETERQAESPPRRRAATQNECNHIVGFILNEVPAQLTGRHGRGALIMASDVGDLVAHCRRYFNEHPVPKVWVDQLLVVDDDAKQLRALMAEFRFCPYCGEWLIEAIKTNDGE